MSEFDGRKMNRTVLEAIRMRAVKRLEAGESPEVVIKALGFRGLKFMNCLQNIEKACWLMPVIIAMPM